LFSKPSKIHKVDAFNQDFSKDLEAMKVKQTQNEPHLVRKSRKRVSSRAKDLKG
jgi:hypothetical protein